MRPLLEVSELEQRFDVSPGFFDRLKIRNGRLSYQKSIVHAVNGVSFRIDRGEVFGLVGESGCGKSTIAKTIIKLYEPAGGRIKIDGEDITAYDYKKMIPVRKTVQMIFQDPYASLNPRLKVMDIITEPMAFKAAALSKAEIRAKAMELLNRVGLGPEHVNRYPHQFSGGQRQRIGIARALSVEPELVIADEPVSALDVSIQAQILNLMMDLKDELGFSYLFITHDLSVVRHISDRIGVMYLGFLVETGPSDAVFLEPRHPYTQALLSAAPSVNEKLHIEPLDIKGEVPTALELPAGCSFQTRCPFAFDRCTREPPRMISRVAGRMEACHRLDS
jgi:peptide/nickel transport system ATP-binding protein/oligopeptide transport system ATP-binding protein